MLRGVDLEKAIINQKVQRSAIAWCKYIFPKQFFQIPIALDTHLFQTECRTH